MFLSAFAVVRHAEALAVKLGEPYGTLISRSPSPASR